MTLMNHLFARTLVFSVLCCLMSTSVGCTLFQSSLWDKAEIPHAANQPVVPTYKVRVYGNGKPTEFVGKLDANKTVQTALEESDTIDKFARMEITLAREVPGSTGRHKMPVTFDAKTRMVNITQDYALHPNDVVVIRKDTSGFLDGVIGKYAGGLGFAR